MKRKMSKEAHISCPLPTPASQLQNDISEETKEGPTSTQHLNFPSCPGHCCGLYTESGRRQSVTCFSCCANCTQVIRRVQLRARQNGLPRSCPGPTLRDSLEDSTCPFWPQHQLLSRKLLFREEGRKARREGIQRARVAHWVTTRPHCRRNRTVPPPTPGCTHGIYAATLL